MYKYIFDPITNNKSELLSETGKTLLKNYIKKYLQIQDGGKYIGKGSYKCVFQPPLKSVDHGEVLDDNFVSAVMNINDAKKEIANTDRIIREIDSDGIYTVCPIKTKIDDDLLGEQNYIQDFEFINSEEKKEFIDNCNSVLDTDNFAISNNSKGSDIKQIIYPFGGKDLDEEFRFISDMPKGNDKINAYKDVFIELKTVFDGLCVIFEKGYTHCDIKEYNILYNRNAEVGRKMKIIDFGFLTKINELFKENTDKCIDEYNLPLANIMTSNEYEYWPEEVKLIKGDKVLYSSIDPVIGDKANIFIEDIEPNVFGVLVGNSEWTENYKYTVIDVSFNVDNDEVYDFEHDNGDKEYNIKRDNIKHKPCNFKTHIVEDPELDDELDSSISYWTYQEKINAEEIAEKIDVFSLGRLILNLLIDCLDCLYTRDDVQPYIFKNKCDKLLEDFGLENNGAVNKLDNLVKNMCKQKHSERLDIYQARQEYISIFQIEGELKNT